MVSDKRKGRAKKKIRSSSMVLQGPDPGDLGREGGGHEETSSLRPSDQSGGLHVHWKGMSGPEEAAEKRYQHERYCMQVI